jgi:DNA polymerase I-like protein with 3'-5' exonuclease and polymerase domains
MMMIYFDLETTADGGPNKDSPEAHWKCNEVLLCGWSFDGTAIYIDRDLTNLVEQIQKTVDLYGDVTLVAHNAKFDIKYLMREAPHLPWERVHVWDTMTWEYLNSGHRWTFPSLENTASMRGVTFKKSLDLGAILATGTTMQQIPIEDLTSYLEEDVRVLAQIQKAQELVAHYWMDYILPLAEMELNGLRVNEDDMMDLASKLAVSQATNEQWIRDYITAECQWQDGSPVTPDDFSNLVYPKTKCIKATSNRMISHLLSGHPLEVKITNKWRLTRKNPPIMTVGQVALIYEVDPTHVGLPVDEDTLNTIQVHVGDNELLQRLIEYRKDSKILDTYLLPMLNQSRTHGTVHPKLNTAVTSTGRLSSSAPNGQNMPEVVRRLIIADHYNELEEIDFKQLEMVGAACASRDKQMIHDLTHDVDIHYNTAAKVFGVDQADDKRKLAKNVNFGVLYGGKAFGLSKQTGVDKGTVQKLIDAFYTRYPRVAAWQREVFTEVVDNMEAHDVKGGHQRYRSDWVLPISGRKFRFLETEAPPWLVKKTGRKYSFSPNHTANYPIQGFAGGDIVMRGLHHLWCTVRDQYIMDVVQFRMTVHDSILLERPKGVDLMPEYQEMCAYIESHFNLPVKPEVDVEAGSTWS